MSRGAVKPLRRAFNVESAEEVLRRRGAEVLGDFVVAHSARHLQAQFSLRTQITGVLHGRFSGSALVFFVWTWMSKPLLNVPVVAGGAV